MCIRDSKHDELSAAAHQFIIRGGRIRGERSWLVDVELDDSPSALLEQVIQSAYEGEREPPPQILVPMLPDNAEALEQALRARRPRGGRVRVQIPERGDKAGLMDRAVLNAGEHLLRYKPVSYTHLDVYKRQRLHAEAPSSTNECHRGFIGGAENLQACRTPRRGCLLYTSRCV